ncbi:prepilin-type N-terminal cleavage/methylation domain-containing protein [Bacillus coahuilensis]|uniref:prepilin-type N-terminal cleavage/methylation domain-containing protein n=1 Tax=Bacillus coahuilensis TaxID=408580 RepID=UPI0001850832|nr:prepilin-type N-terminal cleavage/methylation domain-containing protein [Bacillus coahuilensis]
MEIAKVQQWKERLKARISDNKGVTLIELLATMAIMSILLPVSYGVLLTGFRAYEMITIEGQFREDADYISALIIQTLYTTPFDDSKICDGEAAGECVSFIDSTTSTVEQGSSFYYVNEQGEVDAQTTTNVRLVEQNGSTFWEIGGNVIPTTSTFENSSISLTCTKTTDYNGATLCSEGIIDLHIVANDQESNRSLTLDSQFAY